MGTYTVNTTEDQDLQIVALGKGNNTNEEVVTAIVIQKLQDHYPSYIENSKKELLRKIEKLESKDKETLDELIAKVEAAEIAEKEAEEIIKEEEELIVKEG